MKSRVVAAAMLSFVWIAYALAPLVAATGGRPPNGLPQLKQPVLAFENTRAAALTPSTTAPTAYFFDQILDHSNPSLGTFQQRFWFYEGYYKEGGPIVLFNAGEEGARLLVHWVLLNETITGAIAYAVGGATIVLEHRYWGASVPYANYSTANMSGAKATPPPHTAWILAGGSYPGALAGYVKHTFPNLFYASYGTSGPVQAISNYYGYFLPVAAGAPQNCSTDMKAVITHWDTVMSTGTEKEQRELLSIFGLQNVTHVVDAASALQLAPWSWQDLAPGAGAAKSFSTYFCDTLEVKTASLLRLKVTASTCGNPYAGDECWGTFDPTASFYTDIDISNTYRPWMWTICTQLAFWQNGDVTAPSIVSRLIDVTYWERQCPLWFPAADGVSVPALAPVGGINAQFGGWDISEDHMLFVNGEFDPWRSGSVSSYLPGAPHPKSTVQQPILLIEGGVHCWDMITSTALGSPHTALVSLWAGRGSGYIEAGILYAIQKHASSNFEMSAYKSFAVAGGGTVGIPVVNALAAKNVPVVLLSRPGSSAKAVPSGVQVIQVDFSNAEAVAAVLKEHRVDVVLSTLTTAAVVAQRSLVDAAKLAAVKLFVPSEYGIPTDGHTEGPLAAKNEIAAYLKSLNIPSTRIYTGPFIEGETPASFTAIPDIAGFVAHVLTTLPASELEDRILRLEGERSTLNGLATLFNTSVEHVEGFTGDPTSEFKTGLHLALNSGAESTGWDGVKKAEGTGSNAAGSGNALWPGHQWKSIKEVHNL
ncbi:serine carboxypeptidase S28-domain-containing protein [Mycena galopus ATCC 62051]|nr:serine carboxypeptidase S28-domain-containing protein [Mycena galopus ATCC 62051]